MRDSPGGPVVKNPPSNTGDARSIPGQGTKIPHAAGQLRPCATTTELAHLNEREKTRTPQVERNLSRLCAVTKKILHASTKILCAATKTQRSQKKKIYIYIWKINKYNK